MMKKLEFRLPEELLSDLDKLRTTGADKYSSRNSYLVKIVVEFLNNQLKDIDEREKTT